MWYMRAKKDSKFYYKFNESEKLLIGSGGVCTMQTILDEFESCSPMGTLDCFVLDEMSMMDRVVYGCETLLMILDDKFTVEICAQHEAFMRNFLSHSYLHVKEERDTREKLFDHAKFYGAVADISNLEWWADVFNYHLDRFVPSLSFEVLSHLPRSETEEMKELVKTFADSMERNESYFSWYTEEQVEAKIDDLVFRTAELMVKFRKLRV